MNSLKMDRVPPHRSAGLLDGASVEMAYYGTTLADWTNGKAKNAVGMGTESTAVDVGDIDELKFLSAVMEEFASDHGIGEAEIESAIEVAGNDAVPMDNFIARRLVGLLRVVEKISPAKGSLLLRVIRQGHTYLSSRQQKRLTTSCDHSCKEAPCADYSLARNRHCFQAAARYGSEGRRFSDSTSCNHGIAAWPDAFKAKLGAPRRKPAFVEQWINFYDPSDFVTLGKPLNEENFASDIVNDGTVDNRTSSAHGIVGYLPHKGVIDALKLAL